MEKNHKQIVFLISQAPMNFKCLISNNNFFNREQNNVNSNNNTNKKKGIKQCYKWSFNKSKKIRDN